MNTRNNRTSSTSVALIAALAGLVACKQPKTILPTNTDRFKNDSADIYAQANQVLRADYVFVLDYSFSMQNKVTQLLQSMSTFADNLRASDPMKSSIDYRIGFVNGGLHGTAGSNASNIVSWTHTTFVGNSFIDSSLDATLESAVLDKVNSENGAVGDALMQNKRVLLETGKRTLSAQAGSFIRPEAQLVMVFVSDGDDQSSDYKTAYGNNGTNAYYISAFKAMKPAGYINGRATTAGLHGCLADANWGDEAGTKLEAVAKGIDSGVTPPDAACIYNSFSENLSNLARNVVKPTDRFKLVSPPLNGTLRVEINGANIPSAGNWSFNTATNEIIFVPGMEPAPNAQVAIYYEIPFVLSRKPKVGSIQVQVNGSTVAKDAGNGWSYIDAENRIVFNGSAKPADGADVRITYELQ